MIDLGKDISDWALVCPNCRTIISYEPEELIEGKIPSNIKGAYYKVKGLNCPNCDKFISEKNNRKQIICRSEINDSSLAYYLAATNDKVVLI